MTILLYFYYNTKIISTSQCHKSNSSKL